MEDSLRTQSVQDAVSEGGDEVQGPPRRCTIPTMVLIGIAALVSALASVAGGLVMYFQGLEALEDTVRDSSASEVSNTRRKIHLQLEKVADSALSLKQFVYSRERITTTNSSEWAGLVRSFAYAQVANSRGLYDSTMALATYDPTDPSGFYAGVWGDMLKNGSRELVYGAYGDFLGRDKLPVVDGEVEAMWIPSYSLHPDTGYVNQFVYDWDGNPRYIEIMRGYDPRDGPDTRESTQYQWTEKPVAGSVCSRWWNPRRWYASDGNMYAYAELEAIYVPPPPPHPWSGYKSVSMLVGLVFDSFQPPFDEYRTEHPDTTLLLVERSTGVVYASTEGGMIPDWCQQALTTDNEDVALGCSLNVANLSQAVQEGIASLKGRPYGTFLRTSLDGVDYFLHHDLSHHNLELVWMRPASSVDGKVQEALMYLVIFTTIVLVFDLAISIAEVMFIALPMKRLSVAIRSVADMKTEEAAAALKALGASPLREVGVMRAATTLLVENVSEYKTFLPQALLETDEAQVAVHQRDAPGTDGTAAIVFTDIRGSTQLWEACHSGMSVGLRLHNEVVRRCIAEHNGYEVKTIGDAFMVAFDTADEAVLFGLAVQDQLTKAAWPEDLLREPLCARDDSGDWVGIRVRIGVTYGPVTAEANTVSKRCDYFGPTVNRAARLESVCVGGAVAVEDTLEATLAPTTSSGAIVTQVGPRTLKGISQAVSVSMLVPKTLPKRAHCVMRESSRRTQRPDEELSNSLATETHSTRHALSLRVADKLSRIGLATTGQLTQMLTSIPSDNMSAELNQLVTSTMVALERTDGTMLSLAGGCAVIGWNTSKACHSHVENAFRFAGMMVRALGDNVRCGLSTGPMHSGYVGSQGQRFMTAVGVSSTQAGAAMVYAEPLGVHFAYTSNDTATLDAMCEQLYLRPVDTCTIGRSRVVIHEINRHKVEEWCDDKLVPLLSLRDESLRDDTLEVRGCWGTAYCKAYHGRDLTRLEEMAVRDPDISAVLRRLRLEGLA
eukprot:TRINITY_DN3744_c0_g1_i10.p1 TRINITY_DN3744_c0_g1~~TRINITY_DN3744_c0_g1_i10.p1  ORF type:complete len:1017 (+),score=393.13 TRINITY_DN3744_c0_g1_i10:37-3051(+)